MNVPFTKMHGAGNDYVYVDCFRNPPPKDPAALSRQISDRRFGVGSDGLILIEPSDRADARMRMFNADGSESEMCGNGIRCCAKYVYDHGLVPRELIRMETGAGVLTLGVEVIQGKVQRVRVDMGIPRLDATEIPATILATGTIIDQALEVGGVNLRVTCVSMGNPHCVVFVAKATDDLVLRVGPLVETHPVFPKKTNVEFVEVLSRSEVRQRTWERGSGETWACGTGASAVCVAGVLTGKTDRKILNHLRGGDLELHWDERDDHLFMTGPAVEVFHGVWPA
jgi:diaminopimelate epimerase